MNTPESLKFLPPPEGATRLRLGKDGGIGALRWGTGPVALLFAHANGFCASTYQSILRALPEDGFSVAAIDLRGHGTSTRIGDPARFDRWDGHADDIIEAIQDPSLGITGPIVLAGHSMGGTSMLLAANRRPELARQMTLIDPVLLAPPAYWAARLPGGFDRMKTHFPIAKNAARRRKVFDSRSQAEASWTGRGAFKNWTSPFLEEYCRDGFRDLPDGSVQLSCDPAFEAACFAAQRHDPWRGIAAVGPKLTVLRATEGSTTSPLSARRLEKAGAAVRTIEGTTHFMPMTRPDLCIEALRAALKR